MPRLLLEYRIYTSLNSSSADSLCVYCNVALCRLFVARDRHSQLGPLQCPVAKVEEPHGMFQSSLIGFRCCGPPASPPPPPRHRLILCVFCGEIQCRHFSSDRKTRAKTPNMLLDGAHRCLLFFCFCCSSLEWRLRPHFYICISASGVS